MEKEVRVTPYVVRFGVIYALLIVAMSVVSIAVQMGNNAGVSLAALAAAAVSTSFRFVKDNRRSPGRGETTRLTWWSLLASLLVSVSIGMLLLVISGGVGAFQLVVAVVSALSIPIVSAAVAIMLLLHLAVLWLTYGWFAQRRYDYLAVRGGI